METGLVDALISEVSAFGNTLRSKSETQSFPPQAARILLILQRDGPMTVPQLAVESRTSRQNTQVIVNRLIQRGSVEKTANPSHKRSTLVQLSRSAQHIVHRFTLRNASFSALIQTSCSDQQLESALQTLRRLHEEFRTACQKSSEEEASAAAKPPAVVHQEPAEELPISLL